MGKPEGKIENYLVKTAKENDILCFKFIPSTAGVPDRILIGYNQTVFVETKRPNGKPRKLQEKIIESMQTHGAVVYVADTKDKIDQIINNIINNKK